VPRELWAGGRERRPCALRPDCSNRCALAPAVWHVLQQSMECSLSRQLHCDACEEGHPRWHFHSCESGARAAEGELATRACTPSLHCEQQESPVRRHAVQGRFPRAAVRPAAWRAVGQRAPARTPAACTAAVPVILGTPAPGRLCGGDEGRPRGLAPGAAARCRDAGPVRRPLRCAAPRPAADDWRRPCSRCGVARRAGAAARGRRRGCARWEQGRARRGGGRRPGHWQHTGACARR
jgi:hypothetical protein